MLSHLHPKNVNIAYAAAALLLMPPLDATAQVTPPEPFYVDQGPTWKDTSKRQSFYVQDQGSQLMPLSWLKALTQPDGSPFLADSLARYGYLPNPASRDNLPVGFTFAGSAGGEFAGMTCAACHTRQIRVGAKEYRIDGGPAIADFQTFLTDLDKAVGSIAQSEVAFVPFATRVLGEQAGDPNAVQDLFIRVNEWYYRYHTLMSRALPVPPAQAWGPSRLDAVGMIFNRLTGLDIGPAPNTVIPENIHRADAPTRYPFLWNAPIQDKTQWPGFADNGNDVLALSRNLGEVLGVFGSFEPRPDPWRFVTKVDYLNMNSANFDGLRRLEDLVKDIGPPRWPWSLDMTLVRQGEAVYARSTDRGGCKGCHWPSPGKSWPFEPATWNTPVQDVGTDSREHAVMAWTVKTGVLAGTSIPIVKPVPLKAEGELAFNVLANSVIGSILQNFVPVPLLGAPMATRFGDGFVPRAALAPTFVLPPKLRSLQGAFKPDAVIAAAPTQPFPYESRVLEGIWAAAPYLHNGSVPTLAELLKKPADRTARFKIGPDYDIDAVGLAKEQTRFDFELQTTDCSARDSGNSRCGHDYGTDLADDEKRALLEYLKSL